MPVSFDEAALRQRLLRGAIPGRIVMSRVRLADADADPQFSDPLNMPFWLYLGEAVRPLSLLNIGVGVGAVAATVFRGGRQRPQRFLGLQEGGPFNRRLAVSNIRDLRPRELLLHHGKAEDEAFTGPLARGGFDLAAVCEDGMSRDRLFAVLEAAYASLRLGGVLAVDHLRHGRRPAADAFRDFCLSVRADPCHFPTRYGVGVVTK